MAANSLRTLQALEEYRLLEIKRGIKRKILNNFGLSFLDLTQSLTCSAA